MVNQTKWPVRKCFNVTAWISFEIPNVELHLSPYDSVCNTMPYQTVLQQDLNIKICFLSREWCRNLQPFWAHSRFAPRKWETVLLRNDISHWLGASLESALLLCPGLNVSTHSVIMTVWPLRTHRGQVCWSGCWFVESDLLVLRPDHPLWNNK